MFEREGPRIFSRSVIRTFATSDSLVWKKYSSQGIEQVLFEYFDDSKPSDAATDVLIPSYEISRRFPFFFKSSNARRRRDYDFRARDIARATSAAPSYFEPKRIPTGTNSDFYTLIDGGVFANNPAACALVEAQCTLPHPRRHLGGFVGNGFVDANGACETSAKLGLPAVGQTAAERDVRWGQQHGGFSASPAHANRLLSIPARAQRGKSQPGQCQSRPTGSVEGAGQSHDRREIGGYRGAVRPANRHTTNQEPAAASNNWSALAKKTCVRKSANAANTSVRATSRTALLRAASPLLATHGGSPLETDHNHPAVGLNLVPRCVEQAFGTAGRSTSESRFTSPVNIRSLTTFARSRSMSPSDFVNKGSILFRKLIPVSCVAEQTQTSAPWNCSRRCQMRKW